METTQNTTIEAIMQRVHDATGVSPAEVKSDARTRRICYARYIAAAAIKAEFSHWALQDIAAALGWRSHGAVGIALGMAREMAAADPAFAASLETVKKNVQYPSTGEKGKDKLVASLMSKVALIRERNTAILPTGEIVARGTPGAMNHNSPNV